MSVPSGLDFVRECTRAIHIIDARIATGAGVGKSSLINALRFNVLAADQHAMPSDASDGEVEQRAERLRSSAEASSSGSGHPVSESNGAGQLSGGSGAPVASLGTTLGHSVLDLADMEVRRQTLQKLVDGCKMAGALLACATTPFIKFASLRYRQSAQCRIS